MKILGNIFWLILGGFAISVYYAIIGLLFCCTIVGIPFGLQLIKMAGFAFWPFGRQVVSGENDNGCLSIFMNILWIVLGGIEIAFLHFSFGLVCCLTIIGIPFGLQHFKMGILAVIPFGKEIV
jgi:uncharacterized membrane protein YccF (DUF307 family)